MVDTSGEDCNRASKEDMVSLDKDSAICVIHNKMPNAQEKKVLLTVRKSYTVGDLFGHAKQLLQHDSFELMLQYSSPGIDDFEPQAVYLSELFEKKLPEAGIKFDPPGFRNILHLMPDRNPILASDLVDDFNYSLTYSHKMHVETRSNKMVADISCLDKEASTQTSTQQEQFSDDELALGASASPTEPDTSGNYCNNSNNSSGSNPMTAAVPMIENVDYSASGTSDYKTKLYSDPSPALGYVGLVNQAMTCYLNSLLQALFMTPEFRNALYNWEFDGIQETKSIPYQLQKLFLNLQTSPKVAVETTDLTKSFGWDSTEAWQQHDIQELCRVMFDALEQKFKNTKQADLINCLYEGKMTDYVKCLECSTEKSRGDTFLDIPLPVRPFGSNVAYSSVEEALRAFVQPETLDGNNQYFCEKCNKKCDAHKGLKFAKFPYILTLHLKRFDFDYQTLHRIKLNDKVTFPQTLNLNSFVKESSPAMATSPETGDAPPSEHESVESAIRSDDCSTTDSGSALEEDSSCNGTNFTAGSNNNDPDLQDDDEGIDMSASTDHKTSASSDSSGPYIYELFAIMIHSGSASGGHYYAYIRDFDNSEWYCFNDTTVTGITQEDIQKSFGGGSSRAFYSGAYSSSTNAYMLMYRQMDPVKNARAIKADNFPPHINQLMKRLKEKEDADKRRKDLDLRTIRLKVFHFNDSLQRLVDTKLYMSSDATLLETLEEACVKLLGSDANIPIERCRLVSYDHEMEHTGRSFEGMEQDQIGDIKADFNTRIGASRNYKDLMLEVREEGEIFEVYTEDSICIKIYLIDIVCVDIDGPHQIRTTQSTTVGELKQQLGKRFYKSPESIALIVFQNNVAMCLENDKQTLLKEQLYANCKMCVVNKTDDTLHRYKQVFSRFPQVLTLFFTLPYVDKATLEEMSIPPYEPSTESMNGSKCHGLSTPTKSSRNVGSVDVVDAMMVSPPINGFSNEQHLSPLPPSEVTESNSEDSSLSDGDRTLVESAPDDPGHISTNSNSPACSDPHSSASGGFYPPDGNDDAEMTDISKVHSYYFKAEPYTIPQVGAISPLPMLKVLVDSGMSVENLKRALEPFVKVPKEYFKIHHMSGFHTANECRLSDSLYLFKDSERFVIQLGRALRQGEYKVRFYFLKLSEVTDEMENLLFLCHWIVRNGRTVGEIKQELVEHLATRDGLKIHLTPEKCRLRKKSWKNPVQIYMDDQKFNEDFTLTSSCEFILQEIEDIVQPVTDSNDIVMFVRRFSPSKLELGGFQEIALTENGELRDILSRISGIPTERIEYAKATGQFPHCNISVLNAQTTFCWKSAPVTLDDSPMNLTTDGGVLVYRDSAEELKELTSEERRELSNKEVRSERLYSSSSCSPRRERALKIYLDSSPKKQDE